MHPYAEAFTARDLDGIVELLADDVVFHSPVIGGAAFEGRDATAALYEIVFREVEEMEFIHEFSNADTHVLIANARFRGKPSKVTALLELAPDGKIKQIWMMARPLVGLVAIAEAIGSGLAKREVPSRSRALAAAVKPLAGLAAMTDRVGSRLVASLNRSVR